MSKKNIKISIIFLMAFTLISIPSHSKKRLAKPADRAVMHNNLGVTALYQGDNARALFEFRTALEVSPKYQEAWNNLGITYKYLGKYELAIQALEKAVYLDKKYPSPHNHLGTIYTEKEEFDIAHKHFKKAIKYNKEFADAYFNMGVNYLRKFQKFNHREDETSAMKSFAKATEINPEHPHGHNEMALLYQKRGKLDEAIIRYKLALEISPQLTKSWINLANLYNQTGQTIKAHQAINQAMKNSPNLIEAHETLADAYIREGNYGLAIRELNIVISQKPTHDFAYFQKGFAYLQLGIDSKNRNAHKEANQYFAESIAALESSFNLNPTRADAPYNIGYIYQLLGDIKAAQDWYLQAIGTDPYHIQSHYNLGNIFFRIGRTDKARFHFCQIARKDKSKVSPDVENIYVEVEKMGGCNTYNNFGRKRKSLDSDDDE